MESQPGLPEDVVRLDTDVPVWGRVFSIAPLVVIGTREGDRYDLAPKHMAFPLGWTTTSDLSARPGTLPTTTRNGPAASP